MANKVFPVGGVGLVYIVSFKAPQSVLFNFYDNVSGCLGTQTKVDPC